MEKPFGWVLRVSGGRGSAGALPLSAGCWVGGEPYWALGTVAAVCLLSPPALIACVTFGPVTSDLLLQPLCQVGRCSFPCIPLRKGKGVRQLSLELDLKLLKECSRD